MKQIFVICAVLAAAVFVTADESEIGFEMFAGDFGPLGINTQRLTDEQKKCIQDGWKKVVEENSNLNDWFEDIEKTSAALKESAIQCKQLPKPQQKKCFFKVHQTAKTEYRRLFGNLTEEQKKVLAEFKAIAHECIKKPEQSVEEYEIEDEDDFDVFDFDPVIFKDGIKECFEDGIKQALDDHPELNEWFEEFHEFSKKTAAEAKKCKELSGEDQATCYKKLYLSARTEFGQIVAKLTDDQKKIISEVLVKVAKQCLSGNGF